MLIQPILPPSETQASVSSCLQGAADFATVCRTSSAGDVPTIAKYRTFDAPGIVFESFGRAASVDGRLRRGCGHSVPVSAWEPGLDRRRRPASASPSGAARGWGRTAVWGAVVGAEIAMAVAALGGCGRRLG